MSKMNFSRTTAVGALALLLTVIAAGAAAAQTSAELTGEITDPSSAPVSGAAVKLTQANTGAVRQTLSNDAGLYTFSFVPPGVYDLSVEKPGFQAVKRAAIELEVQQSGRFDFQLQIGDVKEVITVTGDLPLLNTHDATVGTVIDNRRIVELPLNGRNFLQLVSLSANVNSGFGSSTGAGAVSRQAGSRVAQNISISGQRSELNRFTIDGIENTDVNFNTYIVLPSIDALQEFKVQSGVYPAEFGREPGQVNVSTKPGGNEFHGSVFEFLRNDKLDATPYAFTAFRPQKDPFHWNQYGFTLGGPVWIPKLFNGKNRLFFLSNFEGYRDRKHIQSSYNVPSLAMRAGDFSGIAARIFDPATRTRSGSTITAQPFPGNVIPVNRFAPISLKLLEFYPEQNVSTGSLASNYQVSTPRRIDKDQFNQRIDFVESQASTWFGRYSWGDELEAGPPLPAGSGQPLVPRSNGMRLYPNVKQGVISNSRVLRPALVNEFRFGYNRFFNNLSSELASVRDVVRELGIPGFPSLPPVAWGVPGVVFTGFSGFGSPVDGPYVTDDRILQWSDTVSWTHGKHSLRFGAEIRRDKYNETGNSFLRGGFTFNGTVTQNPAARAGTGSAFADFLLGQMATDRNAVDLAIARFRATSQSYFLDDSWKPRPDLTLSLGLRYENAPPWFDQSGTAINVDVPFADTAPNVPDLNRHPTLIRIGVGDFYENAALRFSPDIKVARDGRLGDRLVGRDNSDFAPRLGIAWSPSSRWTLRAGAGMYYAQDAGNPRFDMTRNLAGSRLDNTDPDFPDLSWDRPFHGLGTTPVIARPFVLGNIYGRRTPYSVQYLFNVQRELAQNTVFEIGYMGSVSRKLEVLRLFNQPVPGTSSVAARSPYPEFGLISEVDGSGKASYNSLVVKVQRRFSRGLTYLASYTWSRSIDTTSAIRFHDGDAQFPQDSNCLRCERARSNFDVAHRFVTSILYDLPVGRNAIWGGWQVGSIITAQTGFPFTVLTGADTANLGLGNTASRPNATGAAGNLPADQRSTERFFNTAAFALQPFGSFGNLGRNTLIGPGLATWDASLLKNFRVRERHNLQFRFEAFNLANHPNWGLPGSNLSAPDFGKIRQTRVPMREIQLALKYVF